MHHPMIEHTIAWWAYKVRDESRTHANSLKITNKKRRLSAKNNLQKYNVLIELNSTLLSLEFYEFVERSVIYKTIFKR